MTAADALGDCIWVIPSATGNKRAHAKPAFKPWTNDCYPYRLLEIHLQANSRFPVQPIEGRNADDCF